MEIKFARTFLFTPANRPDRFQKAKISGADGLVIDLEDSVSINEKSSARGIVLDFLESFEPDPRFTTGLRINSIKTQAGIDDLSSILKTEYRPDVLVLPKVEYAAEIHIYDELLSSQPIPYIALIETAIGLYNAREIANASKNVSALAFGGADLAADLGAELTGQPMLSHRQIIVRAAATAGIAAIDVPYLDLAEVGNEGLIRETKKIKAMGFTGKFSIHPKHVQSIISVFKPEPKEIEGAKEIVEKFEQSGGRACEIHGKMIDVPVYRSAKRILAIAEE